MAKINNGTAINIRGNVLGSINPLIEWIRWLSYVPSFTKERIDYIYSKNIRDLSVDELGISADHFIAKKNGYKTTNTTVENPSDFDY